MPNNATARAPVERGEYVGRVVEAAHCEPLIPVCPIHTNNAIVGVNAHEVACTARHVFVTYATAASSCVAPNTPHLAGLVMQKLLRDDPANRTITPITAGGCSSVGRGGGGGDGTGGRDASARSSRAMPAVAKHLGNGCAVRAAAQIRADCRAWQHG